MSTQTTFQTQFNKITEEVRTSLMLQFLFNDPFYSETFGGDVVVTYGETYRLEWAGVEEPLTEELIHIFFNEWRVFNGL